MDLTKLANFITDELNLTDQQFQEIKTFVLDAMNDPDPPNDPELNQALIAMWNRWNLDIPISKLTEFKPVACKIYYYRINHKKSRIFWRILKENIKRAII